MIAGTLGHRRMTLLTAALGASLLMAATPARAQVSGCERLPALLQQRSELVKRIQALGQRNVDPARACSAFTNLNSNGNQALAFIRENKEWCQIPDQFLEQFEADHKRTGTIRAQACRAASQRSALERQARQAQQQQQEQQGAFGGPDGFTGGPWRVPRGAL